MIRSWLTGIVGIFLLIPTEGHADWTIAKRPEGCTAYIKQRGSDVGITVAYFPKTNAIQIVINNMEETIKENTLMIIRFTSTKISQAKVFRTKAKALGIDGYHAISDDLPIEIIDIIEQWKHVEVRYGNKRIVSMDLDGSREAMTDLKRCVGL